MDKAEKFDFNYFEQEAIKGLQNGKPLEGKDGVLAPLIKRLVEASLNGEIAAHRINGAQPRINKCHSSSYQYYSYIPLNFKFLKSLKPIS